MDNHLIIHTLIFFLPHEPLSAVYRSLSANCRLYIYYFASHIIMHFSFRKYSIFTAFIDKAS
jgi:hypothetical protein